MVEILSFVLLFLLIALVVGRVLMLRRRGINVFLFGATDKSDFILMPLMLFMLYVVLSAIFPLPLPPILVYRFWQAIVLSWLGLAICFLSLLWFAMTLISFGESFRVGIDKQAPDKLVTAGMFALSRNPLYIGLLCFMLGMFLIYPNLSMLIFIVLFAAAIHRQILREEKFLRTRYGKAYEDYAQKVGRYF
ncbi:MAG: isoprenylcysteine carboxylmethyltransferase family protein [Clostridia bacterium]|nr:isoprenylcysteine carboxylmethyltransferase family protein [Clostridia bacterium]